MGLRREFGKTEYSCATFAEGTYCSVLPALTLDKRFVAGRGAG
jgi:hypothetical protein